MKNNLNNIEIIEVEEWTIIYKWDEQRNKHIQINEHSCIWHHTNLRLFFFCSLPTSWIFVFLSLWVCKLYVFYFTL